jgi:tetratricopeptide (TPR) repeat protein
MHASSHFSVAACLHKLGSHRDAAHAYMAAYALDVDDPLPLFHLADCLAKISHRPEAIQALERFIAEAPQPTRAAQVRRAQAMVAGWQANAAGAPGAVPAP